MNYTIATTTDIQGNLEVEIGKDGNKYYVCLYNRESKDATFKDFANIDAAFAAFAKIGELIVKALYSEADKREMLLNM